MALDELPVFEFFSHLTILEIWSRSSEHAMGNAIAPCPSVYWCLSNPGFAAIATAEQPAAFGLTAIARTSLLSA
jgi:hypothetical protein